jgi:hypothetical protein
MARHGARSRTLAVFLQRVGVMLIQRGGRQVAWPSSSSTSSRSMVLGTIAAAIRRQ